MKQIVCAFLMVLFSVYMVFGVPNENKDINLRLQVLESNKENLQKDFENKKNEIDIVLKDEKSDIKDKLRQCDEKLWSLTQEANRHSIILWLISIVSIGTISSFFIKRKKWIKEILVDLLATELKAQKELIVEVINQQDKISKIKSQTNITVISPPESDGTPVEKLLTSGGFINVKHETTSCHIDNITTDVIVINDQNGIIKTEAEVISLLNRAATKKTLYFGPKRLPREKNTKKIDYANLDSQLCENLLKALTC